MTVKMLLYQLPDESQVEKGIPKHYVHFIANLTCPN